MKYNTFNIEIHESVYVIRLNCPDRLNPLDLACGEEINHCLDNLKRESAMRCLVITGTGRAFSAGGDIKGMLRSIEEKKPDDFMDSLTRSLYSIAIKLRTLPVPVVAAVNGHAVGAGMNLALSCDFIIASKDAIFSQGFIKLALIPGFGGTHLLPNQVPWQKACEIAMLGDGIEASEMQRLGFVNRVVEPKVLDDESLDLARRLAAGPTLSYARTKELFLRALRSGFEEHIDFERTLQVASTRTKDYAAGVGALNSKLKPEFTGS